ncbi:MAG: DUF4111 domain-containing protein [Oscillospiraceae bacterium]|nr:DUF4111 domain-containing protein [Oscillospiraceae bacterium]
MIGIYVHGSLALGCFNWNKSDIDFIVVVKIKPTLEQKKQYIKGLLIIDKNCPPKGLEMSVVLERYTRDFIYPTPFELHFSNLHKQKCSDNLEEYCLRMNGTDNDLAAHFTIIKNACITIYGNSEKVIFGEVPHLDYLDSIKCDIENAEDEIKENPIYVVLNLCRVLAYTKDNLILSKKDGGYWGIAHVPEQYAPIISKTVNCYLNEDIFKTDIEDSLLQDFAKYMCGQIFAR